MLLFETFSPPLGGVVDRPPPPPPPPDITAILQTGTSVSWDYPNPPADLAGFQVRVDFAPGGFFADAPIVPGNVGGLWGGPPVDTTVLPAGAVEIMVKAVNAAGFVSANEARLTLATSRPGTPGSDEHDANWPEPLPLAGVDATKRFDHAVLSGTLAANAGEHHVLTTSIVGGALTLGGGGTIDQPIVLRGNSDSADPAAWPQWDGGTLTVSAGTRIIVSRLRLRGTRIVVTGGSRWVRLTRLRAYGYTGGGGTRAFQVQGDAQRVRIDRCEAAPSGADGFSANFVELAMSGSVFPSYVDILRNHVHGMTVDAAAGAARPRAIAVGPGASSALAVSNVRVLRNLLDSNDLGDGALVEVRASAARVVENTVLVGAAHTAWLKLSEGNDNEASGNLFVVPVGGAPTGGTEVRGGRAWALNNAAVLVGGGQASLSLLLGAGNLDWSAWPAHRDVLHPAYVPNSGLAECGGNRLTVVNGDNGPAYSPLVGADRNRVAPADAARTDRNLAVVIDQVAGSRTGAVLGANFAATLTQLGASDVGVAFPQGGTSFGDWTLSNATVRWGVQAGTGTWSQQPGGDDGVRVTGAGGTTTPGQGAIPLAPDFTAAWETQSSATAAPVSSAVQAVTYLELTGGGPAGTDGRGIAAVSLQQYAPPFSVEYDYWPVDSNSAVAPGVFADFGLVKLTNGGNLATLAATQQVGDTGYAPIARGVRFRYDRKQTAGGDDITGRAYDGSASTALPALAFGGGLAASKTFAFPRAAWTHLKWDVPGDNTVTVTATFPDGTVVSQSWSDAAIGTLVGTTPVNLVLHSFTARDARWANVTLAATSVPVSGSIPLGPWVVSGPVPAAGAANRTNVTSLPATMSASEHYVVTGNINLGGQTVTIGGGGTSAATTAWLRGNTESTDPTTYPVISNGTILLRASHVIFRRLHLKGVDIQVGGGISWFQLEACWLSDMHTGYTAGHVFWTGASKGTAKNILIAFNLHKKDTGTDSACLFRAEADRKPADPFGAPGCEHVAIYRNRITGLALGPNVPVSGGNAGRSRPFFPGDNNYDATRNMDLWIVENLIDDYNAPGPFIEMKYNGEHVLRNTIEVGPAINFPTWAGGGDQYNVRVRVAEPVSDHTLSIDSVSLGNEIRGNLWVWMAGSDSGLIEVSLRGAYTRITENWGATLPNATAQPSLASADGHLGVRLSVSVDFLDWTTTLANWVNGGGQNWPNAGKCSIGGNHVVNIDTANNVSTTNANAATLNATGPDSNRVAPTTATRTDRNGAAWATTDKQVNTDRTSVVKNLDGTTADYTKIPHRWMPNEVGPGAWNSSFY